MVKQRDGCVGGSGAGIRIEPIGFLVVKDGVVRMLNIQPPASNTFDRIVDLIPQLMDKAEQLLLDLGFHQLRVRIHGKMARIEVLPAELEKLLEHREEIVTSFKKFGFTYVTMDLQGYRMGSMNETLGVKK